ncbi:MAG: phosphoribosylpyrophosphate synthetase [Bacteroidota bacterium]
MKSYDTLTEALADLKTRGYDRDFNLRENCIECTNSKKQLSPADFEITEVYRFEGMTNPSDQSILYAIESKDGMKGTLVNAYGPDADPVSQELIAKLRTH